MPRLGSPSLKWLGRRGRVVPELVSPVFLRQSFRIEVVLAIIGERVLMLEPKDVILESEIQIHTQVVVKEINVGYSRVFQHRINKQTHVARVNEVSVNHDASPKIVILNLLLQLPHVKALEVNTE